MLSCDFENPNFTFSHFYQIPIYNFKILKLLYIFSCVDRFFTYGLLYWLNYFFSNKILNLILKKKKKFAIFLETQFLKQLPKWTLGFSHPFGVFLHSCICCNFNKFYVASRITWLCGSCSISENHPVLLLTVTENYIKKNQHNKKQAS